MSVITPTVIPRQPIFPRLLPQPPQPHPTPLPKRRAYGRLNARRDLQREMDDLSDEENEVEDIVSNAILTLNLHKVTLALCRTCLSGLKDIIRQYQSAD